MAKGKKKKQTQKEAAMDADDGGVWATGPIGDAAEEMDTREAAAGGGPAAAAPAADGGGALFGKQRPGPRGKRSTAQKKRKAAKLERALAVADRIDAKAGHREASRVSKKTMKKLWLSDGKAKKGA